MKNFKRFASVIIALVMMMTMMLPAMAANITVNDAVDGETYAAYKIFDVTNNGDSYAYSIAGDSAWFDLVEAYAVDGNAVFTLTQSADNANLYVVTVNETEAEDGKKSLFAEESDAAAFAKYLEEAGIPADATAADEATAAEGTAVLEGLEAGYYFVDTTLGALCALHTTVDEQFVKEKNTIPSLDKVALEEGEELDAIDVSIGDTVNFQISVTDAKGTDKAIIVHDMMEAGLTLNANSFEVKVDDVDVDADSYTITTEGLDDGCTFEIEFTAEYVESLEENAVIVITYSAVLNENAEIYTDTNTNSAWLDYSNQSSIETPDKVEVKTYEFSVVKTDENDNILEGAEFKLYDAAEGGNEIKVVKVSDNNYRVAVEGEEGVVIEATYATIAGLDAGTYYLEEVTAPAGYNKLTAREAVVINEDHVVTLSFAEETGDLDLDASANFVKVVNKTGSILPSTGGIGTTIFYCVGGILVVAALVLIISKRRMSHEG